MKALNLEYAAQAAILSFEHSEEAYSLPKLTKFNIIPIEWKNIKTEEGRRLNANTLQTLWAISRLTAKAKSSTIQISYNSLAEEAILFISQRQISRYLKTLSELKIIKLTLERKNFNSEKKLKISINQVVLNSLCKKVKNEQLTGVESNSSRQKSQTFLAPLDILSNNKKNINNRSTESESNFSNLNSKYFLKDFYPLSDKDCSLLKSSSNRNFTLNAMNEILLDMSNKEKLQNNSFVSKDLFMKYFSKCLTYEKRDAVKIASTSFKINNNLTEDEKEEKQQGKYLEQIENDLEVSREIHFRKKLAAVFDTKKSYDLCKAMHKYKPTIKIENDTFYLLLNKKIELSETDIKIIHQQALATHEQNHLTGSVDESFTKFEIIVETPFKHEFKKSSNDSNLDVKKLNTIQRYFYAKLGNAYKIWFSKVTFITDKGKKEITLKCPSAFIADYISREYFIDIERICSTNGYKCNILC